MVHANHDQFAAILETVDHANRFLPHTAALYEAALERLVATPAPDIAALAAKMAVIDPFNLDHYLALQADAHRLAAAAA